ncbi:MAG: response regulator, partial [Rhodocyclaceae bacterium]|nr:response regulator [Rhodocyclaceae bacterium]
MTSAARILLIDDDARIRELLLRYLTEQGFDVKAAADGREMAQILDRGRFDLWVLDLMLPGEDGLSICRRLVGAPVATPVIIVTAKGDDIDRILGLELGADDYVAKPFNPRELVARVRAVLRRTREAHSVARSMPRETYRFAGWTLEAAGRRLTDREGADVELTCGEFDLLLAFLTHPQRVLSREQLLDWTRGR